MVSEMLWNKCDLCVVPKLSSKIKIKLYLLAFLALGMTHNVERLGINY